MVRIRLRAIEWVQPGFVGTFEIIDQDGEAMGQITVPAGWEPEDLSDDSRALARARHVLHRVLTELAEQTKSYAMPPQEGAE